MSKILLVEDDPSILEVTTIILEQEGYEVLKACNKTEVNEILEVELPDLILLDIWVSGLDGGLFTKKLKGDDKTKDIPVILVSANTDIQKIANDSGANGYLEKPFDLDDLIATVKKHLS